MVKTWRKLHLSEAFDGGWDTLSVNQDVVLLPDSLMSRLRHVQDVARRLPATEGIQVMGMRGPLTVIFPQLRKILS